MVTGQIAHGTFLFRGPLPLGLPDWLPLAGAPRPTPLARLTRCRSFASSVYLCSNGKIQFGKRWTGSRVAGSFGADPVWWRA